MKHVRFMALGAVSALIITLVLTINPSQASAAGTAYATGEGCTRYIYRTGNRSTCTKYIQTMLNGINSFYKGFRNNGVTISGTIIAADGIFGTKTAQQVRMLQGFDYQTVDGIAGRNTWDALCYYTGRSALLYEPSGSYAHQAWHAAADAGCRVDYGELLF